MRLQIIIVAALALAAGSAAAQGTFNGGRKPSTFGAPPPAAQPYKPYVPSYGAAPAAKPRKPGPTETEDAPVFKPYDPYKAASTYGSPKPASSGAKPCQTSVYVNSCDR